MSLAVPYVGSLELGKPIESINRFELLHCADGGEKMLLMSV
jgi:hypothetical protein